MPQSYNVFGKRQIILWLFGGNKKETALGRSLLGRVRRGVLLHIQFLLSNDVQAGWELIHGFSLGHLA